MDAMQSVASHLDESTGFFQSHGALLTRIDQATENLEQRIVAAARAAEATAAQPQVIAPPVSVAPAVAAPPASFPQVAARRRSSKTSLTDFDPDIASIFTDEAVELIDQSQSALAQWNENRSSVDGLAALKRPLHTLKGGARMAGLMPMGDLSHELETLFMQIDSGVVAPDDRAFSLAQTSLDELARMRESVSSGKGVSDRQRPHREDSRAGGWQRRPAAAPAPAPAVPAPAAAAARAVAPRRPHRAPAPPWRAAAGRCCRRRRPSSRRRLHLRRVPKPAPSPTISAVPHAEAAYVPPPPRVEPMPEPPVLAAVWAPHPSRRPS